MEPPSLSFSRASFCLDFSLCSAALLRGWDFVYLPVVAGTSSSLVRSQQPAHPDLPHQSHRAGSSPQCPPGAPPWETWKETSLGIQVSPALPSSLTGVDFQTHSTPQLSGPFLCHLRPLEDRYRCYYLTAEEAPLKGRPVQTTVSGWIRVLTQASDPKA